MEYLNVQNIFVSGVTNVSLVNFEFKRILFNKSEWITQQKKTDHLQSLQRTMYMISMLFRGVDIVQISIPKYSVIHK